MGMYERQTAYFVPPGPGTPVTVGATSTTAQDISAVKGGVILMTTTQPVHIRFGQSDVGAATTDDVIFAANEPFRMHVPEDGSKSFFRAIRAGGSDATLTYAET